MFSVEFIYVFQILFTIMHSNIHFEKVLLNIKFIFFHYYVQNPDGQISYYDQANEKAPLRALFA